MSLCEEIEEKEVRRIGNAGPLGKNRGEEGRRDGEDGKREKRIGGGWFATLCPGGS